MSRVSFQSCLPQGSELQWLSRTMTIAYYCYLDHKCLAKTMTHRLPWKSEFTQNSEVKKWEVLHRFQIVQFKIPASMCPSLQQYEFREGIAGTSDGKACYLQASGKQELQQYIFSYWTAVMSSDLHFQSLLTGCLPSPPSNSSLTISILTALFPILRSLSITPHSPPLHPQECCWSISLIHSPSL